MGAARKGQKIVVTRFKEIFWCLLWLAAGIAIHPCILLRAQEVASFADPQIKAALREISAGQIQSDIEKLASFQTRSTISAQDGASISAGHGIGAAREWIKSQFER